MLAKQWVAYLTIVNKENRKMFRVWSQTLLPPIITTTLYFVIFGHVIGQRIGLIQGYPYIQFIAPGLIMLSIITNSFSSTVSALFMAKFQRSIEEILVSPTPEWVILCGYVTSGVIRGVLTGTLVAVVALFFTRIHIFSFSLIILVAIIAAIIFSLAGLINAIFARKFDDIAFIPTFVLTPLTYLGGIFYSLDLLPTFWSYISLGNPIYYIVEAFRYGFLGIHQHSIALSFTMMILFILIFYFFALYLLKKGVGMRE